MVTGGTVVNSPMWTWGQLWIWLCFNGLKGTVMVIDKIFCGQNEDHRRSQQEDLYTESLNRNRVQIYTLNVTQCVEKSPAVIGSEFSAWPFQDPSTTKGQHQNTSRVPWHARAPALESDVFGQVSTQRVGDSAKDPACLAGWMRGLNEMLRMLSI